MKPLGDEELAQQTVELLEGAPPRVGARVRDISKTTSSDRGLGTVTQIDENPEAFGGYLLHIRWDPVFGVLGGGIYEGIRQAEFGPDKEVWYAEP